MADNNNKGGSSTITIYLKDETLACIDRQAEKEQRSRSNMVSVLVQYGLEMREAQMSLFPAADANK
jgi:metal-responsive CopG/Arc/MetJ family transcriptional regulator